MKVLFDKCMWELSHENKLIITIPRYQWQLIEKLRKITNKDGQKELDIKKKTEKRSLDANAALWKMLDKMAQVLHTTKEELYLESLKRYGKFTPVIVKPKAVKRVQNEWRASEIVGDVIVNGKKGVQMMCYYGSSHYTREEFTVLLNGVIEDAKDLDVEFISKVDATRMLQEWGK